MSALLQLEHGFCQKSGSERGQIQDWYPNKEMVWYPFVCMVDVVLQGEWVLHCINKNKGDDSQPLLAFRRDVVNALILEYSKEGKLSPSHLGIGNIPSDVCYDNTRHY